MYAYEVIVSQTKNQDTETAIANASNHLATVLTDLGWPISELFEVNVYDGENGRDYGIGLCIVIENLKESTEETVLNRLELEDAVESFEQVNYNRC